jgi:hypothetical protein
MWSDPSSTIRLWDQNERGISYTFGADAVSDFLERNELDVIVRAHQVVAEGMGRKKKGKENFYIISFLIVYIFLFFFFFSFFFFFLFSFHFYKVMNFLQIVSW